MHDLPQQQKPPSHHEYIIENNDISGQMNAKKIALEAMRSLEGWCSQAKGSILIDLIYMLKPKVVVEIGVWGGKSLIPMAIAIKENKQGKVYGIDPWDNNSSIKGMEGVNKEWWGKVDHKQVYTGLIEHIRKLELDSYITLIKKESKDAPEISNIDFLHIDGNHSEEASYFDVCKWVPLVSEGGIIVFDDTTWGTTKRAVEFLNKNCIKLLPEFKGENTWGIWMQPLKSIKKRSTK